MTFGPSVNVRIAPQIQASGWLNTELLTLERLRGKVVMLYAFQMLCPGCAEFATPQAQRVHDFFARPDGAVIGLHSVFENHDAMTPDALRKYVRDRAITFPIAIDRGDGRPGIPLTMKAYALDGTPAAVLIDREGRLRMKRFGHVPDLELGAAIATLVSGAQSA